MKPAARLFAVASVLVSAVLLNVVPAAAQGTISDYQRAMGLRDRFDGLGTGIAGAPTWIGDTERFWYRISVAGGNEFVVVDAATESKAPAFDHARLAAELAAELDTGSSTGPAPGPRTEPGDAITPTTLPFSRFEFVDDQSAIEMAIDGTVWRCDLTSYSCGSTGRPDNGRGGRGGSRGQRNEAPRRSPDGRWEALINNYNIVVREPGSDDTIRLSMDGSEGDYYELSSIVWSPDSTKLAAYRVKPGYSREIHYIESSPDDQLQPKHSTRRYAKPGDRLDKDVPAIFEVASRSQMVVDDALFPNAYAVSRLVWRDDSRALTFEYNQRGHQLFRVIEVEASDGAARAVITEEMDTFFHYSGKKFRHAIDDGAEVIWMSERDGWNHLYMYDGGAGTLKHQITHGEWPVREVLAVDEENRQIYFVASGMINGQDPYFEHA